MQVEFINRICQVAGIVISSNFEKSQNVKNTITNKVFFSILSKIDISD